ncbi:MAG: SAM-dependent DNA methyltransferase [bacterium]|nr:SAM-dependent DNA methyltransferase [bacterium]
MLTENICENKKNGVFYTPHALADFLVRPLIDNPGQTIFDPAFGNGSLLLAAAKLLRDKFPAAMHTQQLSGSDVKPGKMLNQSLNGANLVEKDFFQFPEKNKYDTVVLNPPFVRHHFIKTEDRTQYSQWVSSLCKVKGTSDLWSYFLVKSVDHLNTGGSIGAILPWSFIQADYSKKIREWLVDKFKEIKILALGTKYFPGTSERIIVLWLKQYNRKTDSIKIAFSKDLEDNPGYYNLNKKAWLSNRVTVSDNHDIEQIIRGYRKDYGFKRFEDTADVRIGVVTGADKFFILPKTLAKKNHFPDEQLIPIMSSAKEFYGLSLNGQKPGKQLLLFSGKNHTFERDYLLTGEEQGFHLRAHSRLRTPWYKINVGRTPDAFFPYRMAQFPYMMLNNNIQCTNSIHRVYFRGLTENQKKWVQVSLLAAPAQLALECYSKTYGRGVLKIEPGALKQSIVYVSDDNSINSVYESLSNLLASGDKKRAMITATEFLTNELKIEQGFANDTIQALQELQNRRFFQND